MMVTGLRERAEPGFEVGAEVLGRGSFLQSQRLDGTISTWLSRLDDYKITTMCLNNCKITIKIGHRFSKYFASSKGVTLLDIDFFDYFAYVRMSRSNI